MARREPNERAKPLPKIGKQDAAIRKEIDGAKKGIQDLNQAVGQVNEQTQKANTEATKASQEAKAAQGTAAKAQQTADQAAQAAQQAQSAVNAAAGSSGNVNELKTSIGTINRSFNAFNRSITSSITGMNRKLDSQLLSFNSSTQNAEAEIQELKQENSAQNRQIQVMRLDMAKGIQVVSKELQGHKQNVVALTTLVNNQSAERLKEQKEKEKALRIQAAEKRKEVQEGLLEGVRKSISNTASTLDKGAQSLLGGFSLLDALKGLFGKLLLGVAIANWGSIYSFLKDNTEKLKKAFGLWMKGFVKPILGFFDDLLVMGTKIFKWTLQAVDQVRKVIGKVIRFGFTLGRRVITGITSFVDKILTIGKRLVPQGLKNAAGALARGAGGVARNIGGALGNAVGSVGRFVNRTGQRAGAAMGRGLSFAAAGGSRIIDSVASGATNVKKFVTDQLKKAAEVLSPIKSKLSATFGGIKDAISGKSGPKLIQAVKKLANQAGSLGTAVAGKLGGILGPISGIIRRFPGVFKIVQGLGRESRLNFPIDLLINKYLLGQDWGQAIARSIGSTIGAVSMPVPGLGIAGAEGGDYIVARAAQMAGLNWSTDSSLLEFIPGLKDFMDGLVYSVNPNAPIGSNAGGGNAGAITPVAATQTTEMVPKISGTGVQSQSSTSALTPGAAIQSNSNVASIKDQNVSNLYKPQKKSGGSTSMNTVGGMNLSSFTLPTQQVQLPGMSYGDGSRQQNKKDAQSVPNLDASNPDMAFYENFAASTFQLQLA